MLAGNVAALLSPVVISPLLTYILGPQNYNYKTMQDIRKVDDTDIVAAADPELLADPKPTPDPSTSTPISHPQEQQKQEEQQKEETNFNRAALYSRTLTIAMVLSFLILWPIRMYASSYVFSKPFFTGWIVVGIMWLFITTFGVVVFPLWEGRESITRVVRMMIVDLVGWKGWMGRERTEREVERVQEQCQVQEPSSSVQGIMMERVGEKGKERLG